MTEKLEETERELYNIKKSISFKLGWGLTYPFRSIYNLIIKALPPIEEYRKNQFLFKEITNKYNVQNKNVIFTFIIGDYDNLKDPNCISEGWDYLCFTDNKKLKSRIWQIVYLNEFNFYYFPKSQKKRAMLIMIEYYKYISRKYKIVISVGGQIQVNCNLNSLVKEAFDVKKYDLSICKHPIRDCIYDAAEVCKQLGKDSSDIIDNQMSRYKNEGYPTHYKLYETGIMIRRNNSSKLKKICRVWSNELIKGSKRDQLSLNYVIWKLKLKIKINELSRYEYMNRNENVPFIIHDHLIINKKNQS